MFAWVDCWHTKTYWLSFQTCPGYNLLWQNVNQIFHSPPGQLLFQTNGWKEINLWYSPKWSVKTFSISYLPVALLCLLSFISLAVLEVSAGIKASMATNALQSLLFWAYKTCELRKLIPEKFEFKFPWKLGLCQPRPTNKTHLFKDRHSSRFLGPRPVEYDRKPKHWKSSSRFKSSNRKRI